MDPRRTPAAGRVLFSLAALTVLLVLSWLGLQPPAPRPGDIPRDQFSGERARSILQKLVGDSKPHPTGSAANDDLRQKIMTLLSQDGYSPQIQPGFSCDEFGDCGYVNNIVARLEGTEQGQSVLLACHYDSVAAGPGASDDGAGVAAVLEIARALKSYPQQRHTVILLIDDGEEAGLLGAHVFTEQNPWAKEVRAVVNIDSRGSSGVSWMFETASANEWMVRLMAKVLRRPATDSLTYTIYKQLPNDTDFTVFKAAGIQGVNFANIAGVVHYHTRLDNFDNADPRTLEHHGENALPMVVALANSDLQPLPASEAIYFDAFGRRIFLWPSKLAHLIAWITLILIALEVGWLLRKKAVTLEQFGWGLLIWPATILITAALALGLQQLLRKSGPLPVLWVAYHQPAQIAFGALGIAVAVLIALGSGRKSGFAGTWSGIWLWWGVVGLLIASVVPGLSFFFSVPAGAVAILGIPFAVQGDEAKWTASLAGVGPLLFAAAVCFPLMLIIYTALGSVALAGVGVLAALICAAGAPLLAGLDDTAAVWRLGLRVVPLALFGLSIVATYAVPVFSAKAPERLNFQYWLDSDSGKAEWIAEPDSGKLPDPIRLAAKFQRLAHGVFPWSTRVSYDSEAPKLDLAPPTFTILESSVSGDRHLYRALLRSERGAPGATVLLPPSSGIEDVRMEGWPVVPETAAIRKYFNGWWVYDCVTMPAQGVELTFRLPVGKPVEVWVADRGYGLPHEGEFLNKARPLAATQSDEGDLTSVTRRVELLP